VCVCFPVGSALLSRHWREQSCQCCPLPKRARSAAQRPSLKTLVLRPGCPASLRRTTKSWRFAPLVAFPIDTRPRRRLFIAESHATARCTALSGAILRSFSPRSLAAKDPGYDCPIRSTSSAHRMTALSVAESPPMAREQVFDPIPSKPCLLWNSTHRAGGALLGHMIRRRSPEAQHRSAPTRSGINRDGLRWIRPEATVDYRCHESSPAGRPKRPACACSRRTTIIPRRPVPSWLHAHLEAHRHWPGAPELPAGCCSPGTEGQPDAETAAPFRSTALKKPRGASESWAATSPFPANMALELGG